MDIRNLQKLNVIFRNQGFKRFIPFFNQIIEAIQRLILEKEE